MKLVIHNHVPPRIRRATHDALMSQKEAHFGPGHGESRCRNCRHFKGGTTCDIVAPPVEADGWCKFFVRSDTAGDGLLEWLTTREPLLPIS